MTNRTFLLLGLLLALPAASPPVARAADGKPIQWLAGSAPAPSGSAEEAAQLARQASELAARAAQMAAAAQNASSSAARPAAATTSGIATSAATTSGAATSAAATTQVATSAAKSTDQDPKVRDIQFQNSPTFVASDGGSALPATTTATATGNTPVIAAAQRDDNQVQLVASTFTDNRLLRATQEESLPATPTPANGNSTSNSTQHTPVAPNAYNNGCDTCMDNCCAPQRTLFWVGGVEATFLSPDMNNPGVTFEVEEIDQDRDDVWSTSSSDVDSLYVSPRVWVGIQGCCRNLRYWHMQAGEGAWDPALGSLGGWEDFDCGNPDVGFFSCSRMEAYTVDLELTRQFCLNDCRMQASFGVRHAEVEHHQSITGLATTNEGVLEGFARTDRVSRGTGILMGLYGRKPIFPCSCVNWFYNLRWSALWGPTETAAETFAGVESNDPNFTASAGSVNGAYTHISDTLFIGEVQLGLEWNYALQCLPANAFCRFAVEYQRWDGGVGQSAANSFAGITIQNEVDPTAIASTSAVANSPQMDLFGFTFGTGLTW